MDKRVINTKNKLKEALVFLLESYELKDITVSALCKRAGVNRSTFYAYYDNVSECFGEIEDQIIEEFRTRLYREPIKTQDAYLRVYFKMARQHQTIFKAIHRSGIHNSMIHKMVGINNEILHSELFIPYSGERLEYSFAFSGFYGMIEAWLGGGCKETDEELMKILEKFSGKKDMR